MVEVNLNRVNFHGRQVWLGGGIILWLGLSLGHAVSARVTASMEARRTAVGTAACGLAGLYDDLQDAQTAVNKSTKGLRGHLGALREGRISPGLIKMLALIAAGFCATKPRTNLFSWGIDAAVVAGGANFCNLLDLRPGRALKCAFLTSALSLIPFSPSKTRQRQALLNLSGIALALPADLREKTLLGDTGANALGAAVATTWLQGRNFSSRCLALLFLSILTLGSEKISYSAVIQKTPVLKYLDDLGRLPQ